MKVHAFVAAVFALTASAVCAADPVPISSTAGTAPVSNNPLGTSMLTPGPPDGLLAGAAVNAPLTSPRAPWRRLWGDASGRPDLGTRGTVRR